MYLTWMEWIEARELKVRAAESPGDPSATHSIKENPTWQRREKRSVIRQHSEGLTWGSGREEIGVGWEPGSLSNFLITWSALYLPGAGQHTSWIRPHLVLPMSLGNLRCHYPQTAPRSTGRKHQWPHAWAIPISTSESGLRKWQCSLSLVIIASWPDFKP